MPKKEYTKLRLQPILNDVFFNKSAINNNRKMDVLMFSEKFNFETLLHQTALVK